MSGTARVWVPRDALVVRHHGRRTARDGHLQGDHVHDAAGHLQLHPVPETRTAAVSVGRAAAI